MPDVQRVRFVDSHTGGEPTRVIVGGGPSLKGKTMAERLADFATRFDHFRRAVVNEPRGSEVLVGALLTEPTGPDAEAGVVFFNNVGVLGMCGHGTIGVVETLRYLGRIAPGEVKFDTPVGSVTAALHSNGEVSFVNVPSYRLAKAVPVELDDGRTITGDVAWGGNWFYLCQDHGQDLSYERVSELAEFAWSVRAALERDGIAGDQGAAIDHIELLAPSANSGVFAKNFVLCPGRAYDRSPCGTGTSAKLACLFDDGKIAEEEEISIESITGSVFRGSVRLAAPSPGSVISSAPSAGGEAGGLSRIGVIPIVTGRAWVTAEGELILASDDPLKDGLRTQPRGG